jgi:4-amino-4-deoxy-L-arabinose transferase-like glycosyltransferase
MRLPSDDRALFRLALTIVMAITVCRIAVLFVTPLQLYPDEAQYWWWAQTPDWGYFSKPPLIAWIIWLTTRASDAEWAIRLASPLLHAGTALFLFGIGRLAYNARVGFWSALAYATLPGISYSAGLISTDVPLLFCWAAALYAFFRALSGGGVRWIILCGIAVGFGLLAKYAMLYFVLGAVLAALASPGVRKLVCSPQGAIALLLALLILSPNLIWNAAHGWPTLSHTESNANWSHARYSVGSVSGFVLGQFGVFGPLMMAGWISGLVKVRIRAGGGDIVLAAFSAPILLLIIVQSFISEANANWAAPAYITAVPLAVATLLDWWRGRALYASLALGAVAMLSLWAVMIMPSLATAAGQGNAFKRQLGWRELGAAVAAESRRAPYQAIVAANRSLLAELLYYARPRVLPIRVWDPNATPHDHFQMTMPLTLAYRRVLLVTSPEEGTRMLPDFDSHRLIGEVSVPVGGGHARQVILYEADGYRGPQARK